MDVKMIGIISCFLIGLILATIITIKVAKDKKPQWYFYVFCIFFFIFSFVLFNNERLVEFRAKLGSNEISTTLSKSDKYDSLHNDNKELKLIHDTIITFHNKIDHSRLKQHDDMAAKVINGPVITSNDQHGGFTGIANFKEQPRQMNKAIGNSIKQNIPLNATIQITSIIGDEESHRYATQIFNWMKNNGYDNLKDKNLRQSVFTTPFYGQEAVKNNDNSWNINIGSHE
jgi:hypothetical protein